MKTSRSPFIDKFGCIFLIDFMHKYHLLGGMLCCCSSMPYLSNMITNDTKFYLALVGQALTGMIS